ncbi:MAG: NosD domain-containing protein, partial [Candidatus Thermoplasmatota archaeon]|nr:NosD domain-containing protein [Candidatus Thermoplasmatota archaeon]
IQIDSTAGAGNVLYNNNITNCAEHGIYVEEGAEINWIVNAICRLEHNTDNRIEGNISVNLGGEMLWLNNKLTFSPNYNGQYFLNIYSGGELRLLSGSNITSDGLSYSFCSLPGSKLRVISSEVDRCGFAAGGIAEKGLYILGTADALVQNSSFSRGYHGVIVRSATGPNTPVSNCTFHGLQSYGVYIDMSSFITIENNTFYSQNYGAYAISSNNITFTHLNLTGQTSVALRFESGADCNVFNSEIESPGTAIYLTGSTRRTTICYNVIQGGSVYGFYLGSSTYDNLIYHNRIIGNSNQAYDDGTNNNWYNGYPMGGNYWGDHTSPDVNIDGYVDNPYTISGSAGSQDPYPFALDYGWLRLAPTTPGDWTIDWIQRYHNQTISFAGNIILEEGAKAYFDDNVMNVANLIINSSSIFKLHDTTIYCRNISIADRGILSGDPSDIYVEGDVWIDGKLILDGDNLYMNNSFNGQYGIFVNATGHLELMNGARITANNTAHKYMIHFKPDSTGRLFDSNISYCGWDMTNIGMLVETSNMVIQRMTFYECLYATEFRGPINVNMYNSTIEGSSARAFRLNGGAIVSAVNCSIGGRIIEVMDPGSTFYLKWFLNVKVENGNGYPIAGAEVSVKDGGGVSVGTWYTSGAGRAHYIECSEYRKTQGGTFPYPQPYDVLASYTTFSGWDTAWMDKTVYLTIVLNIPAYKSSGNYTSMIYSAGYNAYWSFIKWDESLPAGTTVTVWVRTGVTVVQTSNTWTEWIQVNTSMGSAIPAAKWTPYIQFRIDMTTADTNVAPLVYQISIAYSPKFLHSITGYDDFGAPGSILYNLTRTLDGNLLLQRPGGNYVDNGTYISPVIDAGEYLDLWRELFWYGSEGVKNDVEFYTRTGEVPIPDVSWSGWALVNSPINSPDHRYIQIRAELSTTDPSTTPIIGGMQILGDVSSSTSSFELRTEAGVPVLHEFYMRRASDDSDVLNTQIDAATEYYFFMRANYSIGWSDNIQLDIWAWH